MNTKAGEWDYIEACSIIPSKEQVDPLTSLINTLLQLLTE
jgi:hypothetical protein